MGDFARPLLLVAIIIAVVSFSRAGNAALSTSRAGFNLATERRETRLFTAGSYFSGIETDNAGTAFYSAEFALLRKGSEDFEIIWSPLPLGVLYHLKNAIGTESAVAWNLGIFNEGEIGLKPSFDSFLKTEVAKNVAAVVQLEYFLFVPFGSKPSIWTAGLLIGTEFHLVPHLTATPSLQAVFQNAVLKRDSEDQAPDSTLSSFPISLETAYDIGEVTKIGLEYSAFLLGKEPDEYDHRLEITFSTAW